MKRIVLPFEESKTLKQGDVVVYNGKCYTTISRAAFLKDLIEDIYKLSSELERAFRRIENLEKQLAYDHGEIEENDME